MKQYGVLLVLTSEGIVNNEFFMDLILCASKPVVLSLDSIEP